MTTDKQNQGSFLSSLGARRVGVDHWTEHDFEMERIGRAQSAETYHKRLETLETHGYVPFRGPFYYAGREHHGGHHPPGTKKRVPTKVAFAMLQETHPEVELEPYKPHPQGWTPPTSTQGMFKVEQIKVEPMKMPVGALFNYQRPETEEDRQQKRWKEFCAQFEGVRTTGRSYLGHREGGGTKMYVLLEHDGDAGKFPETWEELGIDIRVKPEAEELAEKRAKRKVVDERHQKEAAWMAKANQVR